MNLIEAKNIATELMAQYGIDRQGWRFEWTNARTQHGICKYGSRVIGLSKVLTLAKTESEVRNTILHEIAHALVGAGNGHNAVWRRQFINMGGDGKRCNEVSADGLQVLLKVARYKATCGTCGKVFTGHRKRKRVCACPQCCNKYNFGKFTEKYILNFVENNA